MLTILFSNKVLVKSFTLINEINIFLENNNNKSGLDREVGLKGNKLSGG